jgi:hypothetical protein
MENKNSEHGLPDNNKPAGKTGWSNKGAIREQVGNVGDSGKNAVVFFFKEFYNLVVFFTGYFKNRRKTPEDE